MYDSSCKYIVTCVLLISRPHARMFDPKVYSTAFLPVPLCSVRQLPSLGRRIIETLIFQPKSPRPYWNYWFKVMAVIIIYAKGEIPEKSLSLTGGNLNGNTDSKAIEETSTRGKYVSYPVKLISLIIKSLDIYLYRLYSFQPVFL